VKLGTRLWLSGAFLPALVLGGVLLGADRLFHFALERSLDQALLAQAAVESVSLFDGPGQKPHLHMATSPLVESVKPFAPRGVLFGPDGREVMRYPPEHSTAPAQRMLPDPIRTTPRLTTHDDQGERTRQLAVTVRAPDASLYTLKLSADLAQVDRAVSTFQRLAMFALLATTLILIGVQSWQSRSLSRRLLSLSLHIDALRRGDLSRKLERDTARDELASLREVLSQATEALARARDAQERLVADAAHELRTPLTIMRTSLDLALRRERSIDELKQALLETREEVERLASLASRLLDVAAGAHDGEPMERTRLDELCREAVQAIGPAASAAQRSVELHAAPLSAAVRPLSVRRAVDNLLWNAVKYAEHSVVLHVERAEAGVRVRVCDDGPGIPMAEREAVFEPFHRVRGSPQGAGLGLAIVREVARVHGGRAYVANTQVGAEVCLELPDPDPLRDGARGEP
jgi:signal transduction histidine kinase